MTTTYVKMKPLFGSDQTDTDCSSLIKERLFFCFFCFGELSGFIKKPDDDYPKKIKPADRQTKQRERKKKGNPHEYILK